MDNQQQNLTNLITEKYLSGYSANKISKELNKNVTSIMRILRKNNVPIRTIGENVVNSRFKKEDIILSKDFRECLIGLLMGDGSLHINKNGKTPYYSHTDKNLEAINHFKSLFEIEGIKTSNI